MSQYCITLENVTKKFGKYTAVDNISIALEPGKVYGIVGPNGAGKSTTMAMIMGSLIPTSGKGTVMGHPLASKEALACLGYSPEFTSFYSDMSALEYLWYMATISGIDKDEALKRAHDLIVEFQLEDHQFNKVAKFSTGMKKKISLAQAMISDPQVLLLDEPTANLDPTSRMEILGIVREMVEQRHLTVLISSHVLTELETVIDHVIMINHGKIVMDDEISAAQDKFKNGTINVETSDNASLLTHLADKYNNEVKDNLICFSCKESNELKKDIVKVCYEHDIVLNRMEEELLSLDSLYKQALEEEQNEEHNN